MEVLQFSSPHTPTSLHGFAPFVGNPTAARAHSWDSDAGDEVWGECSGDEVHGEGETTPGSELVRFVLRLFFACTLSAQQACVLFWLAFQCGIEEAKPYGLKPGSPSGHYSRKLKTALGITRNTTDLYHLEIPGHSKHDLQRTRHVVPCLPMHEQVAADLEDDVGMRAQLAERVRSRDLPPIYWDHPIVRAAGASPVAPLALYIDAVPYSHTDSVLGFWMSNLVSGRRFLFTVLRKKNICKCGCRGWCSFYPVFRCIRWSLEALARAEWPQARHDGADWQHPDRMRAAKAGTPIRMRACCLYVKGDWAEYSSTLGFPTWADSLRPCYVCSGFGSDLYVATGNTKESVRWRTNQIDEYDAACTRCELRVLVRTVADRDLIVARLRYDKRSSGAHGRALCADIPALFLRADDRLEPGESLPDVANLETLEPPVTLLFWRPSEEAISRHRNPIFDGALGTLPARSMTVDTLHTIHLGVMNVWARVTIWELLHNDAYGATGAAEEKQLSACLVIRHRLLAWYKQRHEANPGGNLTRVADLTVKMLGTKDAPKLKTKAAETWGLTLFLVDELRGLRQRAGPHAQRLLMAGEALVVIVHTLSVEGWIVSEKSREATTNRNRSLFQGGGGGRESQGKATRL